MNNPSKRGPRPGHDHPNFSSPTALAIDLEDPEEEHKSEYHNSEVRSSAAQNSRRSSDHSRSSGDALRDRNVLWVSVKLEEMGLPADLEVIRYIINKYPANTSQDQLLEFVIFGQYDEPKPANEGRIQKPHQNSVEPYFDFDSGVDLFDLAPVDEGLLERKYCSICWGERILPGNFFCCNHWFCKKCLHDDLRKKFKDLKINDIYACPANNCNRRIDKSRFIEHFPEFKFEPEVGDDLGTCSICYEDFKGYKENLRVFNCEHYFCKYCTISLIVGKVLSLKCPDCLAPVVDEKLKGLVSEEVYQKYCRFRRNALIERDPNIRWCSRPNCENFLRGTSKNPKCTCVCGRETCFNCGNQWHPRKTCEQALEDEYKMYAKNRDVGTCPECRARVEKDDGCNHMTCPICTYEWCWLCGGEYSKGHYEELNPLGCPGLQGGANTKQRWKQSKLCLKRIGAALLIIFLCIFSPLWIVLGSFLLPNFIYESDAGTKLWKILLLRFALLILGIVLSPLVIVCGAVGLVIPGSCILIGKIYKHCKKRAEAKKRRKEILKQKMGTLKQPLLGGQNGQHLAINIEDF